MSNRWWKMLDGIGPGQSCWSLFVVTSQKETVCSGGFLTLLWTWANRQSELEVSGYIP